MAELTDEQINAAAARLGFKEQHRGVLRDFARTILALSATGAEDAEMRKKAARYDWLRNDATHREQDSWLMRLPENADDFADKKIAAAYRALATQQAAQGAEPVVDEIANTLMDGVERYRFECEGGALENCVHWRALRDHANGQQVAAALIDPEGHAAACRAFRSASPQPTAPEKKE